MSSVPRRPGHKELAGKINAAQERLEDGNWDMGLEYELFMKDCEELGLYTDEEQTAALKHVMKEVRPEHYRGPQPPRKGSRGKVLDRELFEFVFTSKFLNKEIYLKFAVYGDQLFIVSFHKTRK